MKVKSGGFTIIEALIGITIVALIGAIIVDVLSRSFTSTNKSQLISIIKQNGQSTINLMDQTFREAQNVVCVGSLPGNDPNTTLTIVKGGEFYRFTFAKETASLNGKVVFDKLNVTDLNTQAAFYCTNTVVASRFSIASTQDLTDANTTSGVSLKSGSRFDWTQSAGSRDYVSVTFGLGPPIGAGQNYSSQFGTVEFKTTAQLRSSRVF